MSASSVGPSLRSLFSLKWFCFLCFCSGEPCFAFSHCSFAEGQSEERASCVSSSSPLAHEGADGSLQLASAVSMGKIAGEFSIECCCCHSKGRPGQRPSPSSPGGRGKEVTSTMEMVARNSSLRLFLCVLPQLRHHYYFCSCSSLALHRALSLPSLFHLLPCVLL